MVEDARVASDEIWLGRAEVRPLDGASPELDGATYAFVVILAYASSREAFMALFDEILAEDHLELVELEEVALIRETWDLDEKVWYALDTAESGDPSVMIIHGDTPVDGEDEDMALVRAALSSRGAVQFRQVGSDRYFLGYPLDTSDTWALFHIIDTDFVALNGYFAIRSDCFIDAEIVDDGDTFMLRAIERRGEEPVDPELPLDRLELLLAALSERYPLVGLSDTTMPDVAAVGRITRLGADKVTLRGVTTLAEWTTSKDHLYRNIEAIRFGHAYESALASVLS
jgi:hypothetical protein